MARRKDAASLQSAVRSGVVRNREAVGELDGSGIKLYWDRPRDQWPRDEACLPRLGMKRWDLAALLEIAR